MNFRNIDCFIYTFKFFIILLLMYIFYLNATDRPAPRADRSESMS